MGNNSLICSIGCSIEWETCLSHANPDGALLTILWLSVLSRLKLIPEFEKAALLRDQIFELRTALVEKEEADAPAWERERRRARLGIEEAG